MSEQTLLLGEVANGEHLELDVDALIGEHVGIVATTGGGKSGLIRVLCEATHGLIQHIILDDSGEFYTLRERFEYVIAGGDDGDFPISVGTAASLATATLEHGFSLIVDLSEMKDDRFAFVGAFMEALTAAPKRLWHPVLVVVDEAQRYVPQDGATEASAAIKDFLDRGRKRGFTGVLAGTRLSKIDKDATGMVKNWFCGLVGQALDRRAVSDLLGFRATGPEANGLMTLQRQFWAYGGATASRPPRLFRVQDAATTILRRGHAHPPAPPPPEALRAILEALKPPPEPEASEAAADAPAAAAGPDVTALLSEARQAARKAGYDAGKREGYAAGLAAGCNNAIEALGALISDLRAVRDSVGPTPPPEQQAIEVAKPAPPAAREHVRAAPAPAPAINGVVAEGLSRPSQKILEAYRAFWPQSLEFRRAAAHAGVGLKSSQFGRYEPELQASGELEELSPGIYRAKTAGDMSRADLLAAYAAKLSPAHRKVLDVVKAATGPLQRDDIAVAAEVSVTSSTTGAALNLLRELDVVEKTADGRYQMNALFR